MDPKTLEKLQCKLWGFAFSASSVGNIWNGVVQFGCFYYQLEGNKTISFANAEQLKRATWFSISVTTLSSSCDGV